MTQSGDGWVWWAGCSLSLLCPHRGPSSASWYGLTLVFVSCHGSIGHRDVLRDGTWLALLMKHVAPSGQADSCAPPLCGQDGLPSVPGAAFALEQKCRFCRWRFLHFSGPPPSLEFPTPTNKRRGAGILSLEHAPGPRVQTVWPFAPEPGPGLGQPEDKLVMCVLCPPLCR